jgi:hypothetical protein
LTRDCPADGPPPPAAQVIMNPFHAPSTKIASKDFDKKVKTVAKRTLG